MSPAGSNRARLDRARIVDAGVRVARTDGIEALSMRRVADELGTAAMSLYRHVADRADLLLGMLDVTAAGIDLPPATEDPRAELVALMHAMHEAFRRDPWVVTVLLVDGLSSPLILPFVERLFEALERGGHRGRAAVAGYAVLFHFLYGETIAMHHQRPDTPGRTMMRTADPARFPALARVTAALPIDGDRDFFAENLAVILDGLLGPISAPDAGSEDDEPSMA